RRIICKEAVSPFAVLAERLPMIRRDDNERAVERPGCAQAAEKAAERRIGVRDLAVVGLGRVPRPVRFGRGVGFVGIAEMDPGGERVGGGWWLGGAGWWLVAGSW